MKKGRNTDGQLRSPYTGVVVNVRADEGDVVSVGTPIFDIRRDDDFSNLIAMVYVSSFDGARIKPGTIMELNPYRDEETERGELLVVGVLRLRQYHFKGTFHAENARAGAVVAASHQGRRRHQGEGAQDSGINKVLDHIFSIYKIRFHP